MKRGALRPVLSLALLAGASGGLVAQAPVAESAQAIVGAESTRDRIMVKVQGTDKQSICTFLRRAWKD